MMPKSRMAAVTSVVMMGRRMKSSARFMAHSRGGVLHQHFGAREKTELAVRHHCIARRESFLNHRLATVNQSRRNGPHLNRLVGLDRKTYCPCCPLCTA